MGSNFGVNTIRTNGSTQTLTTDSLTVLGVVGTSDTLDSGLHYYGNISSALSGFEKDSDTNKYIDSGSLVLALQDLDLTMLNAPVILNIANVIDATEDNTQAVVDAIAEFKTAKTAVGYFPDVVIAPDYSNNIDVRVALDTLIQSIKSIAIVDIDGDNESEVTTTVENISSDRLILTHPKVVTINEETRPMSTFIASMIAQVDASWEYGYSDSFSNRVIPSISGLSRNIEYIEGETCEADRLRTLGVTTAIYNQGLRSWGGETTSNESAWKSLNTVRVFDKVMEAAEDGLAYAIDRNALQTLPSVQASVNNLLNGLQGSGVILGFDVSFPADLNTEDKLMSGEFSMVANFTETPLVKKLVVTFSRVGTYSDRLLDELA